MAMSNSSHPALSAADDFAVSASNVLMLIGRVFLGWLFLASGWAKLGNIAGATAYFTSLGVTPPGFWAWFAGFAELGMGALLILGLATRYAAIASFIWVLVATAIAHRYWTYPPQVQVAQYNNFLKNIAIMGGSLYVLILGAGRYAIDAVLAKR